MRHAALLAAATSLLCATAATPALADNPVSLYPPSGPNCAGGCGPIQMNNPTAALLVDVDGNGGNEVVSGGASPLTLKVTAPAAGLQPVDVSYPVTGAVTWVRAGDLDNDGDPDLAAVVATTPTSIPTFLNNGNGTFTASTVLSPAASVGTMALGDINGDGALDIVIGRAATSALAALSYLPGRGDGSFGSEVTISTAAIAKSSNLKLADFDGDGDLDIAGVRASTLSGDYAPPRVVVSLNAGDGTFAAPTVYDGIAGTNLGSSSSLTSRALATGDFDGDGDIDLAFTGGSTTVGGSVTVLRNAGNGSFGDRTDYPASGFVGVYGLLAGDLDGDGDQDLTITGNANGSSGKIGYLAGQGPGGFVAGGTPGPGLTPYAYTSTSITPVPDSGDIDGDGTMDLALPSGNEVTLMRVRNLPANTGVGQALISELRLSGPGGTGDQYVDVYNRSMSAALNLGGWKLRASNGATVRIEQGTMVPAGGHLLLTGPRRAALGWSLDDAGKSALQLPFGNATADPANGGIALVGPSGRTVDAVGFGTAGTGYREGTALTPVTAIGELAYVRRFADGQPVDTDDNTADFIAVDTKADGTTSAVLGAPRPDHTQSPTNRNDFLQSTLVDPTKTASQSPNRVITPGQITINRTIVNCSGTAKTDPATADACVNAATTTGKTIKKLRFRITDLTTVGTPGTGKAVLKAVTSTDATVDGNDISGIPLDAPSDSAGGGVNSTLTATSLFMGGGFDPGQKLTVAFTFEVTKAGKFSFAYNTEDDLIEIADTAAAPATPAPTATPEAAQPELGAPVADLVQGTVPVAALSASVTAPATKPAAAKAPAKAAKKCVTKAKYKRLSKKHRLQVRICAAAKKPAKKTPAAKTTTTKKAAR